MKSPKRRIAWAAACAVFLGVSTQAQLRPPPDRVQEIQQLVNEHARRSAENVSDRARATTVGALSDRPTVEVRRWNSAIKLWKKERNVGGAPLLAEGVLMDCLGRMQGVKTPMISSEVPLPPPFANLVAQRPKRAAKLFQDALKRDSTLIEARLRRSRIRAADDSKALRELETLAGESAVPFNYLAAISRAEVARAKGDAEGAIAWYLKALTIHPGSTAATIALSSLQPMSPVPFGELDGDDVYYSYPCTVLTPAVSNALAERIAKAARR